MKYEPKEKDVITRGGYPPITILKLTPATAKWDYKGQTMTEPREIFDSVLAKSVADGAEVHRDGVRIVPPSEKAIGSFRGFLVTENPAHTEGVNTEYTNAPFEMVYRTTSVQSLFPAGTSGSHNTHARLAPSHSKTWATCTAALAYCEANKHLTPKDTGSIYADEGTAAHDHAADVLLKKKTLDEVPAEMREPIGEYVNHCLALVPDGVRYEVEVEVPLFYQPDSTGTCDFAVVTDDLVVIRDYKHGAGVLVTSEGNTQLAIYAYSLIKHLSDIYDFTDDTVIDIKVVQPRHHMAEDDEPWVLPLSEFREFCAEIEAKAKIATAAVEAVRAAGHTLMEPKDVTHYAPEAEFVPQDGDGGSCRWCKAKAFCGVRHAHNTSGRADMLAIMPDMTAEVLDMEVVTDELVAKDGETLKLEFLAAALKNRKKIEKWLGDVEDYLNRLDHDTITRIGLKYVKGRDGNRVWTNEDEAEGFARRQGLKQDERCTIKLKTPAQIEAALKEKLKNARTKNRFEALVTRSEGRPVLVPAEDKRPALPAPGDVMPNMEDEI
jgi:RecB family exonuclease